MQWQLAKITIFPISSNVCPTLAFVNKVEQATLSYQSLRGGWNKSIKGPDAFVN